MSSLFVPHLANPKPSTAHHTAVGHDETKLNIMVMLVGSPITKVLNKLTPLAGDPKDNTCCPESHGPTPPSSFPRHFLLSGGAVASVPSGSLLPATGPSL